MNGGSELLERLGTYLGEILNKKARMENAAELRVHRLRSTLGNSELN